MKTEHVITVDPQRAVTVQPAHRRLTSKGNAGISIAPRSPERPNDAAIVLHVAATDGQHIAIELTRHELDRIADQADMILDASQADYESWFDDAVRAINTALERPMNSPPIAPER